MNKSELNILIVEDDKSMSESLSEAVKRKGYRPVVASRKDEALSIVKIKTIHALIVDVMLPGINGVDLVEKLKENLNDNVTIIFISGIYKDKTFIAEAVKKVGAHQYYTKPFNTAELFSELDKRLNEFVEVPKVDMHALLATPYASNRERRKALDHVEKLTGYDLPLVFCILLDSQSTGYLNIVDKHQNIFGVTFVDGAIAKIDSESTALHTRRMLVAHGFIQESDFNEFKAKEGSGDMVKNLVESGLVSPHVSQLIKSESISNEFRKMINDTEINMNFVPDRKLVAEPDNLDNDSFMPLLTEVIIKQIPIGWLKQFYLKWSGHKIRVGPQFADQLKLAKLPGFEFLTSIQELFKKELTLEEIVSGAPQVTDEKFYRAIHLMMLRRVLVFDEAKNVKNIDEHTNKLKSIYDNVNNKDPFEIFTYFGLATNPRAAEVSRVYKDFAKTYHPDTLPQSVSGPIKKLNHELFAMVTFAYETLSNEEKKAKYLESRKQKEVEKQIQSDDLITAAAAALNRGQYSEALPLTVSALKVFENERSQLHHWWALLKMPDQLTPEKFQGIQEKMRAMSPEARKTTLWIFINGLTKIYKKDIAGAEAEFQRAIEVDSKFMAARRELAQIKANKPVKMTTEDVLTGDLGTVLKNIFKKKKGA